jgi:hypothetical protein
MNRYLPSGIYPSSVPLPVSPCAPSTPSLPPPPPPDVLGPVEVPALPTATAGLTAEAEPGLTPRSLVFNKLLKKFCNTSCCVCPVGLGAPPARLPPPLPLPSISASARSTVGSEKVDEPSGPTRPAVGRAVVSTGLRKIPRGSRSARRAFSS